MREKTAERIAGTMFTVVVPGVMASMIPHIPPDVGWPIIGASVLVGLSAFLHTGRRFRMWPMIVMAIGSACFIAGAVWNYIQDRYETKAAGRSPSQAVRLHPAALHLQNTMAARTQIMPIGPAPSVVRENAQVPSSPLAKIQIYLECHADVAPQLVPDDRRLTVHIVNYIPQLGERLSISKSEMDFSQNSDVKSGQPISGFNYLTCTAINYSDMILTNVTLDFKVYVMPKGFDGGYGASVLFSESAKFDMPKLEPGSKNAARLIIENQSHDALMFEPIGTGVATPLGQAEAKPVVVTIAPESRHTGILPVEVK